MVCTLPIFPENLSASLANFNEVNLIKLATLFCSFFSFSFVPRGIRLDGDNRVLLFCLIKCEKINFGLEYCAKRLAIEVQDFSMLVVLPSKQLFIRGHNFA